MLYIQESNILSIDELCKMAGVWKFGFYAWIKAESKRNECELRNQKDFERIPKEYLCCGADKGTETLIMRLKRNDHPMNRKKVR